MEVNQIQIKKILCVWSIEACWPYCHFFSISPFVFCLLFFGVIFMNDHETIHMHYSCVLFTCIVHKWWRNLILLNLKLDLFVPHGNIFFVGSKIIDPPIIFRPTNIKNNKNKNKNKNLQLILEVREINSQVFNTLN